MTPNPKTVKALFGNLAPYADDAARAVTNNGDDLAKLHRRLSQYDSAVNRVTPEMLQKHPELGNKFANLTRRLGNEASLKMPLTNANAPTSTILPTSVGLRAGAGGNIAGIFEDASTMLKHPDMFKNGDDAVEYLLDRNIPALKNTDLLNDIRSKSAGYVPDNPLQGIESIMPPEIPITLDAYGSRSVDGFNGDHQVLKNMFKSYSPYNEGSILFPDGFPNPDDVAKGVANYGDDAAVAAKRALIDDNDVDAYWDMIADASGTTYNPVFKTINVRGKDIHVPLPTAEALDEAGVLTGAAGFKERMLNDVLKPDYDRIYGDSWSWGPEYSVESVGRYGENIPNFPTLTNAVRAFEEYGLDDTFGGDVYAASNAYNAARASLQSRLNTAASMPEGWVPIDEWHSTGYRPHKNTALGRWYAAARKLPF